MAGIDLVRIMFVELELHWVRFGDPLFSCMLSLVLNHHLEIILDLLVPWIRFGAEGKGVSFAVFARRCGQLILE